MSRIRRVARVWLPIASLSVFVSGLVFVMGQQVLRMGANDPQIQMAEDVAATLSRGESPSQLTADTVDISQSLAPFLILFDDAGAIVGSSATLRGQTPELPSGVLEFVRDHGQDRITWQPASDVRIAAVIERVAGGSPGFVLAGRSLREVQQRESVVQGLVLAGLALTLVGTLIVVMACELLRPESGTRKNPSSG